MRKILVLLLVLMIALTSCASLKGEVNGAKESEKSTISNLFRPSSSNSKEEATPADHVHCYEITEVEATCTTGGYTLFTCSVCGISEVMDEEDPHGHVEVALHGKAATETESGLTDGKICSVCNTITVAQQTITALGHSYTASVTAPTCTEDGYTTYTCSGCGDSYVADEKEPLGHSYTASVTAPTCTMDGYTTYTCSGCGDSYVADEKEPLGHVEVTVPGKAPTNTEFGLTDGKKCTVCGVTTVAQTSIPATGHSYSKTVIAPTCTESGYTVFTCSDCGDVYTTDITSPKGHSEQTVAGKAATCTTSGLTDGKKCSVCNTVTVAQTTISALGHTEVTVSGKAATCTTSGLTDGKKCSVCNTVTVAQTTISALGHNEVTVSGKAATCTASGLTDGKKCSVCNTVTVAQTTISALGHTEVEVSGKLPTCTATGLTDGKKCSVCATVTVQQTTISALGHNWQAATTEAPKTCIACGATEGEKLPSNTGYSDTLTVTYINVGQGDSILIQVGDCDILIDAGVANMGSTVSTYLKNHGVDDIELMINTHPDADHCGGLTTVLNNFVVEEVWISKDTSKTTAAYTNFTKAISAEGLTAKQPNAGTVYTYEYLTITVLYSAKGSDANNSSIVVMLEYGSFKFLFTGDIGEEVEKKLISSGADLSCDVLKVGHHGSAGSSTASFLNATGAEYGVICVGSNSYGHPTSSALSRLSTAGISVYRTDQNGNIVFSTNGATLTLPGGGTDSSGTGSGSSGSGSGSSSSGSTSSTEYFIGNTESKIFHLPTCSNLPATSKQNIMYNYSWIVNIAGYTPCGRCLSDYSGGSSSSGTTSYIANKSTKVYHLSTCSYLPDAANRVTITSTSGYTPCSRCIGSSSGTKVYIANIESKVYHLSTCSYLPAASKQEKITNTAGYTPCGHCIN